MFSGRPCLALQSCRRLIDEHSGSLKQRESMPTLAVQKHKSGHPQCKAYHPDCRTRHTDVPNPQLKSVFLLGGVHTLGNLLTNMSLGAVAVSFTHTIKAMEPFFSVVLSALFLGDVPSLAVLATLVPIVGGVALASMAEVSFNWLGFLTAMGSNLTFQSRNVLSKKLMLKKEGESVDNLSMFGLITAASFLLLAPFSLALEGWPLAPAALEAAGMADPWAVIRQAGVAGLCFHSYQQLSYMILSRVSPVTHSIGNCVKRVIVILAAVVFFSTPINAQSASGTAIALGGVFAYSQVKRLQRFKAEEECQVKWDKDEECVVPDMTIEDDATASAGNKYEEVRATS
mmetsp:Transcript_9931/g.29989  ORF Transcript_9931/g.29989 Transcript_9931/m.29989 type:complete len:343 (-) Transcript_9931:341-1369(-)